MVDTNFQMISRHILKDMHWKSSSTFWKREPLFVMLSCNSIYIPIEIKGSRSISFFSGYFFVFSIESKIESEFCAQHENYSRNNYFAVGTKESKISHYFLNISNLPIFSSSVSYSKPWCIFFLVWLVNAEFNNLRLFFSLLNSNIKYDNGLHTNLVSIRYRLTNRKTWLEYDKKIF